MAVYSKENLSGSTNGRPILITPTSTAGETIHDAHATATDEIWLYAWNSSAATVLLTIEYGGVSDPADIFEINIPPVGAKKTLVIEGMVATGSVNIDGFAGSADVVSVQGFVNRIT